MKGSIIAILYGLVLVIFFVFLVVMTITLIMSKDKKNTGKVKNRQKKKNEFEQDEYYDDDMYYDDTVADSRQYYDDVYDDKDYADDYVDDTQAYDYSDTYADDNKYDDLSDSAFGNVDDVAPQINTAPSKNEKTVDMVTQETYQEPVKENTQGAYQEPVKEEVPVAGQTPVEDLSNSQQSDISYEAVNQDLSGSVVDKEQVEEQIQEELPQENLYDSAFAPYQNDMMIDSEELDESVKEAEALGAALENEKKGTHGLPVRQFADSNDDFYWYNKLDVAEKPSYKTREMYYHYFNLPKDCIEELLIEMYDCALVRTEELKYIAYGIKPVAVSMKEILTSGNRNYVTQQKIKEPTTQDLVKIYEKWCSYVDKLFEKVEIHADEFTFNEIRRLLYEFGRSDVDVLIEGL